MSMVRFCYSWFLIESRNVTGTVWCKSLWWFLSGSMPTVAHYGWQRMPASLFSQHSIENSGFLVAASTFLIIRVMICLLPYLVSQSLLAQLCIPAKHSANASWFRFNNLYLTENVTKCFTRWALRIGSAFICNACWVTGQLVSCTFFLSKTNIFS